MDMVGKYTCACPTAYTGKTLREQIWTFPKMISQPSSTFLTKGTSDEVHLHPIPFERLLVISSDKRKKKFCGRLYHVLLKKMYSTEHCACGRHTYNKENLKFLNISIFSRSLLREENAFL